MCFVIFTVEEKFLLRAREKPSKIHYIQMAIESQQERAREGNREAYTGVKRWDERRREEN